MGFVEGGHLPILKQLSPLTEIYTVFLFTPVRYPVDTHGLEVLGPLGLTGGPSSSGRPPGQRVLSTVSTP